MGTRLSSRNRGSKHQIIKRVEISGGIASGKTTLARALECTGPISIYEDFRKNPFLSAFYRDPVGTAFETEVTFLLQHYHQQKNAFHLRRTVCSDFSLILDHAYACVTLAKEPLRLFRLILKRIEGELPPRSLLIHLICPPEMELRRIRRRNRHAERTVTADYLEKINGALSDRIRNLSRSENILVIDSDTVNFAHDPRARVDVCRRVTEALRGA